MRGASSGAQVVAREEVADSSFHCSFFCFLGSGASLAVCLLTSRIAVDPTLLFSSVLDFPYAKWIVNK
jgi:hypothetical protein